ncbi:peptide-methionine (S)-S-oxide reductase MsrA [Candidatus Colwellia aromaticivorans]|uniref:peptide-methionine (S)-S-oxide reductase MsrA n=1 Tax=Candidatus Colwellia aromaticivorans TaxID=2267621 RepID=UPI000DF31DE1|nr:peptide-methionine (S)-S-oxide reductase MsrA [Candidatus Colwellia aromaticivorans]
MANITDKSHLQHATLAGGCFWCIEGAFSQIKGIHSAISGYMGGHSENPTYENICTGNSGHAEVVQLSFDPQKITYQEIIEIFFTLHNPTQLNRQGNDIGSQYRSAIFYHDESQQSTAEKTIREMSAAKIFEQNIVTQVCPAELFYSGEEYHQGYANKNPQNQYCQAVVSPKLAKFRQTFVDKLK